MWERVWRWTGGCAHALSEYKQTNRALWIINLVRCDGSTGHCVRRHHLSRTNVTEKIDKRRIVKRKWLRLIKWQVSNAVVHNSHCLELIGARYDFSVRDFLLFSLLFFLSLLPQNPAIHFRFPTFNLNYCSLWIDAHAKRHTTTTIIITITTIACLYFYSSPLSLINCRFGWVKLRFISS